MTPITLSIDTSVWDKMWKHAQEDMFTECGGHLLGVYESKEENVLIGKVYEVVLIEARGSQSAFEFSADEQMEAYYYGKDRGLSYLGTYHSHGQFPAIPSPDDNQVLTRVGREFMLIISPSHKVESVYVCYKDENHDIVENPFPLENSNCKLTMKVCELEALAVIEKVENDKISISKDMLNIEVEDCGGIKIILNEKPAKNIAYKVDICRKNGNKIVSLPISYIGYETSFRDGLQKAGTYVYVVKAYKDEIEIAASEPTEFMYQPLVKKKESRKIYTLVALLAFCLGVSIGWGFFYKTPDTLRNSSIITENRDQTEIIKLKKENTELKSANVLLKQEKQGLLEVKKIVPKSKKTKSSIKSSVKKVKNTDTKAAVKPDFAEDVDASREKQLYLDEVQQGEPK